MSGLLLPVLLLSSSVIGTRALYPVVITTWELYEASKIALKVLRQHGSAVDAVVEGCSYCERKQCRMKVGYGGSPDESGETTLDALVMDGTTMNVGAVGSLRYIKEAISVARHVLHNTEHSLLVGEQATEFAVALGFNKSSLTTNFTKKLWSDWSKNKCQPNFWKNVKPDPKKHCGPYAPASIAKEGFISRSIIDEKPHDTIGIVAMDLHGNVAAGTSTNGLSFKIQGRVGDSPVAGSGGYAISEVGGAAATGNGDILMRFMPSFHAVLLMESGIGPSSATEVVARKISTFYPHDYGAIVAMSVKGEFGAACYGYENFPFMAINGSFEDVTYFNVDCV